MTKTKPAADKFAFENGVNPSGIKREYADRDKTAFIYKAETYTLKAKISALEMMSELPCADFADKAIKDKFNLLPSDRKLVLGEGLRTVTTYYVMMPGWAPTSLKIEVDEGKKEVTVSSYGILPASGNMSEVAHANFSYIDQFLSAIKEADSKYAPREVIAPGFGPSLIRGNNPACAVPK